jgi:hypothetical protein
LALPTSASIRIDVVKDGFGEIGELQVCTAEVGSLQVGAFEVRAAKIGSLQVKRLMIPVATAATENSQNRLNVEPRTDRRAFVNSNVRLFRFGLESRSPSRRLAGAACSLTNAVRTSMIGPYSRVDECAIRSSP